MRQIIKQCFSLLIVLIVNNNVMADDIRDRINKTVETIRDAIPERIEIEDVVDYIIPEESMHSGTVKLKEVKISGIKDFDFIMNYVWMITYIPRNFVLTLENIDVILKYDCDVNFFKSRFFRFWGDGAIRYKIEKLVLVGNISITGGVIAKEPFEKVTLNISHTRADLPNLLENDEFSTMVTDFINNYLNLAELFENNHESVTRFLTDASNKIVKNILNRTDSTSTSPNYNNELRFEEDSDVITIKNLLDGVKMVINTHFTMENPMRELANISLKIINEFVEERILKPENFGNFHHEVDQITDLFKGILTEMFINE